MVALIVVVVVAGLAAAAAWRLGGVFDLGGAGMGRSVEQALERGERDAGRTIIELSGAELAEVVTEGLEADGVVMRELTIDITAGDRPDRGTLTVSGGLGNGDGTFHGRADVAFVGGDLRVEMDDFALTGFSLPGAAHAAAGELISEQVRVEPYLTRRGVRLREVTFADDLVRIVAVDDDPADGAAGDGGDGAGGEGADGDGGDDDGAGTRGPARVERGEVDAPVVPGDPAMVVVGDSVAAGVGVDDFADSYVARVHGWLQRRDDADYGLVNLARSGETSWSLRDEGQLDAALAELERTEPALVVVDIGANDVLSALHHPACRDDVTTERCRAFVDGRLEGYRTTYDATLADLRRVAPRAPMLAMTTYNPFSFGGRGDLEARGEEVVGALNRITERVAARHGVRIADAAAPLQGRAGELTHMTSGPSPDVHPNAAGYDALAGAAVDALQAPAPAPRPGAGHAQPQ